MLVTNMNFYNDMTTLKVKSVFGSRKTLVCKGGLARMVFGAVTPGMRVVYKGKKIGDVIECHKLNIRR